MKANPSTLTELIAAGKPGATALSAPGGAPLSYEALRALVRRTIESLNAHGVGRNDRVAIVLDNGPQMAAAFVTIGAGATAAPLNPAYREDEFEFYLTDLRAKLLVVGQGSNSPAVA
ncbi:MAG: AMP-binding protein, partial [Burkholderiales bacterium]|nr:AMP-binding protein [Burkholderiales bacterium]